jgi:hypothetical protein
LIVHTSIGPGGTLSSVAAATAALATAFTDTGGTNAPPASGMDASDWVGSRDRARSSGAPEEIEKV